MGYINNYFGEIMHQKISYTPQAQTLLSRNPEFRSNFYYLISLIFEFNGNQSIDIKVSAYTGSEEDNWSKVYINLDTEDKSVRDKIYSEEWYPILDRTLANVVISGGQ